MYVAHLVLDVQLEVNLFLSANSRNHGASENTVRIKGATIQISHSTLHIVFFFIANVGMLINATGETLLSKISLHLCLIADQILRLDFSLASGNEII